MFLEFWAHSIRRPELRRRFAETHARILEPLEAAVVAAPHGRSDLLVPAPQLARGLYAMQLGLGLERMTDPDAVPIGTGPAMTEWTIDQFQGGRP